MTQPTFTTVAQLTGAKPILPKSSYNNVVANQAALIANRSSWGKQLDEVILAAPATTMTFSSITGGFTALYFVGMLRGDAAQLSRVIRLTFNGDSGSNYQSQGIRAESTTVTGSGGGSAAFMSLGDATAASAPATSFAHISGYVYNYDQTDMFVTVRALGGSHNDTSAVVVSDNFGVYTPGTLAAITSMTFALSSGDYDTLSYLRLYGVE